MRTDTVDGSHVPDAGDFILSDFSYDTRFNGQTGAIISAVATRPRPGATVSISDGHVFVSDLQGTLPTVRRSTSSPWGSSPSTPSP